LSSPPGVFRKRGKPLGVTELIAIALGGMVGGGIFTVLGISVAMVGVFTPLAIAAGGLIAALAAYSYIKLGVYYQDEGATYSFYKKTFPNTPFAASLIGWWVIFGYISTLALYAYTFASYAISGFSFAGNEWVRKLVAGGIIAVFTLINLWSVKGMGKIEDLMVYSKLVILAGNLEVILEFGSVTFLLVSMLMACANHRIRKSTHASATMTILSILTLITGTGLIIYHEATHAAEQICFIGGLYVLLTAGAFLYARANSQIFGA